MAPHAAIPKESPKSCGEILGFSLTRSGSPSQFNLSSKEQHVCSWPWGSGTTGGQEEGAVTRVTE